MWKQIDYILYLILGLDEWVVDNIWDCNAMMR